MAKLYGEELRQNILKKREHTLSVMKERDNRIANWQTDEDDCFVSIRMDEHALSEYSKQLRILDGDGMMDFEAVIDESGNEVRVRWANTRYGTKCIAWSKTDKKDIWAASIKALCKKTGWHVTMIRVPVWTKFVPNGGGLYGAYCGSYEEVRWHTNMVTGEYFGYPE